MTSNCQENFLESVIQITEQRDRDSLELSLVSTFLELTGALRISLYRLREAFGETFLTLAVEASGDGVASGSTEYGDDVLLPLADNPLFAACLEKGEMVSESCGTECVEACQRYLYPVTGSHGVVGFMEIYAARYSEMERKLADGFLRIYRNYLAILDESEHDTLTGLLNRKTFDRNIARILASRRRADTASIPDHPCRRQAADEAEHWLAVLDIDYFKRINDRFGHLYGDEVLLLLARIMRQVFRHGDKLFRFGGEEFVVVLEPTTFEDAYKVFERFRKNVENFDFPQVGRVTISLGFTRIGARDVPATVVGHADEALYYAKHHGRNQVRSYELLVEEGQLEKPIQASDLELF
ncbi:MAG: GGDEF domain-containing protein [Sulfuricellaceae bacterium]|jgi:diguanylate cyclase (GGDEF)-like protein